VKRCLALAVALRGLGVEVKLLARDLGVDYSGFAALAGVDLVVLRAPTTGDVVADSVTYAAWAGVSWQTDASECIEVLRRWQPDWVVVDHYSFDARWHRQLAQSLGTRLAAIDDLADRDLDVDVVVDHNLSDDHRRKYGGRLLRQPSMLGGPRYALLGPAYAAMPPFVVNATVGSVGIFMGGVDASDLSSKALRACRDVAGFAGPVEIVITSAYPHAAAVRGAAARSPGTTVSCDLPDLAAFFSRHDLQIGAGGGASWERCCAGAPTIAVTAAANQDAVLPELARRNAVALVPGAAAEASIGAALKSLLVDMARRAELSANSRALVDGLGAKRVALRLAASLVTVRRATIADAAMMYDWRNHPATRGVSTNAAAIAWPDHLRWLEASLVSDRRTLLIGQVGSTNIGVVRFDRDEQEFEVSLYLDPALHGLGLGSAMLAAGEAQVRAQVTVQARFVATVLEGNTGSERMFASAGYELRQGVWRKAPAAQRVDEGSKA
jgi:UDP-2,4-diacetamido-2,4,6-trideoxy-beta-L-altropyranose hydrolase